jgi:D-alanyl-D-alanine-carboxypeptidase/D-alanyl-D-alanine-endopeptidase
MRPIIRRALGAASTGAVLVCTVSRASGGQAPPASLVAPDSAIRAMLARRVDDEHQSVGIVVGIVEPAGRRIIAYGHLGATDRRPVDGNTLFEIGSISKVFTSLLLADMASRDEVNVDEPVQRLLPAGATVPARGGRQVTLVDLATHTSALPPMPANFTSRDAANPYADYTAARLLDFLSSARLARDIGTQFEYSNLGGGLLGFALAHRAHADYESLVRLRILDPLGMRRTRITLTPEMTARFATGHDAFMDPVPHWEFLALDRE